MNAIHQQRSSWRLRVLVLTVTAVAAGAGAIALRAVLELVTRLLLGRDAGDLAPVVSDFGRYGIQLASHLTAEKPWLLPVFAAAGLVAAAKISQAGRTGVAGTDSVIAAINSRDIAGLHLRGAGAKLGGTALTIGSGGSAGTEGPVAHIGAACGAFVARRTRLTPEDSAILVAAGLAGGVGALFHSPIGAAVLAAELLRRRGADWRMLLPSLLVAPASSVIYSVAYGRAPMFWQVPNLPYWQPGTVLLFAILGTVCGLLARLYASAILAVADWLKRSRGRRPMLTAGAGGAIVGLTGLVMPMALGTGYGTIRDQLCHPSTLPFWVVLLLPLVKIAATAITLGSGGVGGVFGPAMVIGAAAGTLCWRVASAAGVQPGPATAFVIAGIAACLGAAVRAPLAAIIVVIESTGYPLPPIGLFAAVGIATVIMGNGTLFPSQPAGRAGQRRRPLRRIQRLMPNLCAPFRRPRDPG